MSVCAACGRESPDDARFCAGCGAALAPAPAALEERKTVSIVFVDLVGSTARAERLDPEDVRALLASYHARARAELERHGGTVEKFIGDAVVAVFGAPVVHEDDPERAVRAALAIRDGVAGSDVHLRIAVNTGEALVSLGARPDTGEGMVAGDVVNTAARLQSAAPVDGILVGESTYRATAHAVTYREAEPVVAKGKLEPIPVWEALSARSRFGSDLDTRPAVRLVGREPEVDTLRDALARARRERSAQLVTVIGVPGIGKSRLVSELFAMVDADAELIRWRQGRCLPYGEGISFWALGEMVKAEAGVLETDTAVDAERKLEEAVAAVVADPEGASWMVRHLRPLLGLGGDDERPSQDSRGEAFAAWRRFLEALAEQGPAVLVFEDLHWADEGLLDFLDALVDRATTVPLLVVCSARPELLATRPGWGGGKANAATLSLSPLSAEDTARLLAELLEQAVLPADMQRELLARAEGNPLFAEEYVRMLRDRGLLRHDGGVWRLDAMDVAVPETVGGIIAARLDALDPAEKALLQAASVVGKVFWAGAAAEVAGVSRWEGEETLHTLERKELVRRERRSAVGGEVEHAFRHALVRDVAYGQIPRARRAELHLAAAAWIGGLAAERAEDRAEMLAHHYLAALELLEAAGRDTAAVEEPARLALRDAADRASMLTDFGAAARAYRRALDLWPAGDRERPYLLLELGRMSLFAFGANELPELAEARDGLLALGDATATADAEFVLGNAAWNRGLTEEALAHLERAVALVADAPPSRVQAAVLGYHYWLRQLSGAEVTVEEGERLLELARRAGTTTEILDQMNFVGVVRAGAGDVEGGLGMLRDAVKLARDANSSREARSYLNLASLTHELGDVTEGARLHREGLEVARRYGLGGFERWLTAECALDDLAQGDWGAARSGAEAFLAESGRTAHYMAPAMRLVRAMLSVATSGNASGAIADVEAAVEQARDVADPQLLWPVLAFGAQVAADCGHRRLATRLVDELVRELAQPSTYVSRFAVVDAVLACETPERASHVAGVIVGAAVGQTAWIEAVTQAGAGDLGAAAATLERAGDLFRAAHTRLCEAEQRGVETTGLHDALAFFRRVGADAFVARGAALLQASA